MIRRCAMLFLLLAAAGVLAYDRPTLYLHMREVGEFFEGDTAAEAWVIVADDADWTATRDSLANDPDIFKGLTMTSTIHWCYHVGPIASCVEYASKKNPKMVKVAVVKPADDPRQEECVAVPVRDSADADKKAEKIKKHSKFEGKPTRVTRSGL